MFEPVTVKCRNYCS